MKFFAVALPGLEDVVRDEIAEWFPDLPTQVVHGGVNVEAPLGRGLALNLVLKTPTRILLRIQEFRARDFPTLYKTFKKIQWRQFVDPACELEVHVSTRLSRLKIKARIAETCQDAWLDLRHELKIQAVRGRKIDLYVRFVEDVCTLSLDTSGERLHKRGSRKFIGEAPLRETIAAALLQMVARSHASTETRGIEVVDPMMGSGTFLLEAASRDDVMEGREFAFDKFAEVRVEVPSVPARPLRFESFVGFEADEKTYRAAKENLKSIQGATLKKEDFFTAEPLPPSALARWVFCNPPYGERIKVKEPLADLYVRLFNAVESQCRPDLACFLLPSKVVKGKFRLPLGWKVVEKRPFVNGGIPVTAFVFQAQRA